MKDDAIAHLSDQPVAITISCRLAFICLLTLLVSVVYQILMHTSSSLTSTVKQTYLLFQL